MGKSFNSISESHPLLLPGLLILLGLLLRLPELGYSFYGDENFSVMRDSSRLITDTEDRFRPVFFSLLYLWRQIGFHGEIGLRLLPLLFGLLQIPLAFAVGTELRGRKFGFAFALLIAVSPMLIEFSQELRMYSLVACLALLQVWLFLRIVRQPSAPLWAAFVLTALAGVYTHLFYWLFLAGMVMSFLRERKAVPLWKSASAMMAVVLLYLPNLPNLLAFSGRRGGDYVVHLPSALPKVAAAFTVGFNYFKLPEQGSGRAVGMQELVDNGPLTLLVILAGLLILAGAIRLHFKDRPSKSLWLGHELSTLPILLASIGSVIMNQYFLQPKYLIFSTPFALLLIADSYRCLSKRCLRWTLTVIGLIVVIFSLIHFWNPAEYGRRENWKEAARVLSSELDDETVLVLIKGPYRLLDYYIPDLRDKRILIEVPQRLDDDSEFVRSLRRSLAGKRAVFYLRRDTIQNLRDPHDRMVTGLGRIGINHEVVHYNPRFQLHRWTIPPPSNPHAGTSG